VKASVVISVRNRSQMLLDCFRGLAAQTLDKGQFEVVVIDNCSTEDLGPVLGQARDALGLQIRSARTARDNGPAPARNIGAGMASGEVIAFTDSDCRPTPEWLERGLAAFEARAVAMVSGPVLAKPEQSATFTSKTSFVTATEHPTFPTANLMVRRQVFEAMGGFDISLSFSDPFGRATECADTDLAWRIIGAGHQRRFVAEAVVHHELEAQGFLLWLLEPTRLFLVPELVRRHPGLRDSLLWAGLFFHPRGVLLYLGLLLLGLVAWVEPMALAALPAALLSWAVIRKRTLDPRTLLAFCMRAPLHACKLLVMNLSLLYGSIRFRSVVL